MSCASCVQRTVPLYFCRCSLGFFPHKTAKHETPIHQPACFRAEEGGLSSFYYLLQTVYLQYVVYYVSHVMEGGVRAVTEFTTGSMLAL